MNRREFQTLMSGAVSWLLFETLFSRRAFAGTSVERETRRWLEDLHSMTLDLRASSIPPRIWQERIGALFDEVSLEELLEAVDFSRLTEAFPMPDRGVHTKRVAFPPLSDLPGNPAFIAKIFGMQRDRAIIPHGHRNMVSCHVVLEGTLHLRQYERIRDEETFMILEPSVDEVVGPATHSSISDEKNNVHWLIARSDRAFTFDVIVLGLGGAKSEVENLDPREGRLLRGGRVRVPKLGVNEALAKYGHVSHHD